MSISYEYFVSATDTQGWITAPGESVAESIDGNLATFWNPIGATGNHTFSWVGDLSGTTLINGVNLAFDTGFEPQKIKVWSDLQINGGILLGNFNNPAYITTLLPGYSFFDASGWTAIATNKIHLELEQQHNGPFHFNEVNASYNPNAPLYGFPTLLKRSFTGRNSYKVPGRKKPRYSSYADSVDPVVPLNYNEVV